MSTSLPRGIQLVKWRNKDKSKQIRYRVRVKRKDVKADRLFDSPDEAIAFLNEVKAGRAVRTTDTPPPTKDPAAQVIADLISNPPLSFYANNIATITPRPKGQWSELQYRRFKNREHFYKVLMRTQVSVFDRTQGFTGVAAMIMSDAGATVPLGDLRPREVTTHEINSYILERRKKGIKPISIARELTYLSTLFKQLPRLDPSLTGVGNPVAGYDKSLLKPHDDELESFHRKREFRLTEQDERLLLDALPRHPNPDFRRIVLLSLFTGMRRSEILTLTWGQIREQHIQLYITKSRRPRKVVLTREAKDLIAEMSRGGDDAPVFNYRIGGFEGSFSKFKDSIGLKHLRFHDLRREFISRMVERFGASSSVLLAELMGFQSVAKFEELHMQGKRSTLDNERELQASVGHASLEETKGYTVLHANLKD